MTSSSLTLYVSGQLKTLAENHLKRQLSVSEPLPGGRIRLGEHIYDHYAGNDYFGLAAHPQVRENAAEAARYYGAGSTASRLLSGNLPLYTSLESKLANYKQRDAALVFGSGYLANLGVITALMGKDDLIVADKLAHACMLDGARLSGATVRRFQHNSTEHLATLLAKHRGRYRHCLILTESVFSMDGDLAPLEDIAAQAKQYDGWLLVDDAHGLGLPDCDTSHADILIGTMSKGLGGYGGFVAANQEIIEFLTSATRSFLFTTALPPSVLAAAETALDILAQEPERAEAALTNARQFSLALKLPEAESPVVPYIVGESHNTLKAAEILKHEKILTAAIRPPTVPPGTARIRFSFSSEHNDSQLERLIHGVRQLNIPRNIEAVHKG
jgi:8-amino-7-oxononanoate synthase